MPTSRRNFTGAEKVAILREHLIEKVPISQVCEKHGLQPTVFYQWQKKLFEEGAVVLERVRGSSPGLQASDARRIEALASRLQEKNEVLAEFMGEYVALKKTIAALELHSGLASKR
jgi:transposase-like protein